MSEKEKETASASERARERKRVGGFRCSRRGAKDRARERERVRERGVGDEERWHDRDKRAATEKTTQERAGALSSRDTRCCFT